MPLRNLAWLLAVPGLFGLGLAVSYSAPRPDRDYVLVRQVVDVLAEVDANYYRKLSDEEKQQLVEDMINGGLKKLDPHSEYMTSDQLKRFESDSEGSFGGIGILLAIDPATKFLKVDHPMPGTPAYEAGLLAGDLIVKVGGTSTQNNTIPEARKLIAGEPGTPVTLTIRRAGRNPTDQDVTVTRARVSHHPVSGVRRRADDPNRWEWFLDKPSGIAYIRLTTFNELTAKELKAAVEEIERAGGKGLILDLRDNGGGLLSQAIEVVDLFLSEGKIVSTHGRNADKQRVFEAKKGNNVFEPAAQRPMVILVNDNSASASEIVAAALQDHKRAVIVGERTYGKGSVQKLLRLGGDPPAAVKLTTERWWRPNGENMDRGLAAKDKPDVWGVKPDIEVPMTMLEKARADWEFYRTQWVGGKPGMPGVAPPTPPKEPNISGLMSPLRALATPNAPPVPSTVPPFVDPQLHKAVEVLKGKLK